MAPKDKAPHLGQDGSLFENSDKDHEMADERDLGAFIPAALDDYGLDPQAFRLYAHLSRRAGFGGRCWAGLTAIATTCHISIKTIRKKLDLLEELRMIRLSQRPGRTNTVTLTNVSEWVPPEKRPRAKRGGVPKEPRAKVTPLPKGPRVEMVGVEETGQGRNGMGTQGRNGMTPLPNETYEGTPSKVLQGRYSPEEERESDRFFHNGEIRPEFRDWLHRKSQSLPQPPALLDAWIEAQANKPQVRAQYLRSVDPQGTVPPLAAALVKAKPPETAPEAPGILPDLPKTPDDPRWALMDWITRRWEDAIAYQRTMGIAETRTRALDDLTAECADNPRWGIIITPEGPALDPEWNQADWEVEF